MAFGRESGGDTGWSKQDPAQTPHWMKLLEEKYQRLHAKILNQAARFTTRRHSYRFRKGPTARCVKDSRQGHKQAVASQAKPEDCGNFDQNLGADESYGDETNEAEKSDPACDSHAKITEARGSLDCADKAAVNKLSCKLLLQQGKGTRTARPITDCFENDPVVTEQETPRTSGVVTRVSSALALTRLSSESEFFVNSNGVSRCAERAAELRLALDSQLERDQEGEESSDGNNNDDDKGDFNGNVIFADNHAFPDETGDDDDDNESVRCLTDRGDMEVSKTRRRRRLQRPVKTSVSRVSHKTTKSCPPNFWEENKIIGKNSNVGILDSDTNNNIRHNNVNNNNGNNQVSEAMLSLTARGIQESRMRVFARMSLEARHAIDETLKDMKNENELCPDLAPVKHHTDDGVWPIANSNHETFENNYGDSLVNNTSSLDCDGYAEKKKDEDNESVLAESEISIPSNDSNAYAPVNRLALKNRHIHNSSFNSPNLTQQNFSRRLANHADSHTVTGRRLPQIDRNFNGAAYSNKLPNSRACLPGIGKVQVPVTFRENTFEITPPDFDIRFHQIISCQTGDRETPPLDIRQQSIEKCQQWLVRYMPRQ